MAEFKMDGRMIFLIFFAGIIGTVLLSVTSDSINLQTNTLSVANESVTVPAVNGSTDITGRELIGSAVILNSTNVSSVDLEGLNMSVVTGISSTTGLLTVQLVTNDTGSTYAGQTVNVTYDYNPDGYISDAGARNITLLIIIFGALAILVTVIAFLYSGSFGDLIRSKR